MATGACERFIASPRLAETTISFIKDEEGVRAIVCSRWFIEILWVAYPINETDKVSQSSQFRLNSPALLLVHPCVQLESAHRMEAPATGSLVTASIILPFVPRCAWPRNAKNMRVSVTASGFAVCIKKAFGF